MAYDKGGMKTDRACVNEGKLPAVKTMAVPQKNPFVGKGPKPTSTSSK